MKLTKIVSVLALSAILLSSTSFAQWWKRGGDKPEGQQIERRGGEEKRAQRGDKEGRRGEQESEEGMEQRRENPNAMFGREEENKPDNWEEMSAEERQAFMKENRPEQMKGQKANKGQQKSLEKRTRNFLRKAKKAKNYKKFNKQLRKKKEFKDGAKIKNKDAVDFLQQRGILDGYEDGSFGPENPINRAESLKVLLESLGEAPDEDTENEFEDVPEDAWFAGYVKKAKRKGIVKGYEDGTFQPARTVNQVELLKLAFESFGIDLASYDVTSLPEGADVNSWYAAYLQYALDNDLLDEEDVAPGEGMTREMFSEVMYRLIQQQEEIE
jgi:hypothetical protein